MVWNTICNTFILSKNLNKLFVGAKNLFKFRYVKFRSMTLKVFYYTTGLFVFTFIKTFGESSVCRLKSQPY